MKVASTAVSLIPLLTPRSLEHSDKQYLVDDTVGLASDATAVALLAKKSPYDALRLLELGRGIISGSLNEMRTDISELQRKHPGLAEEYAELRDQLDAPKASTKVSQRYALAKEFESLVEHIRSLPGFDRFLLAPTEDEFKAAAAYGPIVIVNVSDYSCDALIVEKKQLGALQLPRLQMPAIRARAKTLANPESLEPGLLELLEWLWETVAEPVLNALGLVESPRDGWPRIWWIPTGLLARFPIHAAGRHSDGSSNTVLDRAVSSYSSSVKTLVYSRQNRKARMPGESGKIVLVGMEKTPGQPTLQFASREIKELERLCDPTQLQVTKPRSCQKDVLAAIHDCKVFHFAGHGRSDSLDPSISSLLLSDGPLTVASLFETNLHSYKPFLAYLSACGTGQVRHDRLLDEGLHLIGACQLAGFQHVVGTLWDVNDESCVEAATTTYEWIQKQHMSGESVSEGLHRACRKLRNKWVSENAVRHGSKLKTGAKSRKDGQVLKEQSRSSQGRARESRDIESYDDAPLYWVPYVHFGI